MLDFFFFIVSVFSTAKQSLAKEGRNIIQIKKEKRFISSLPCFLDKQTMHKQNKNSLSLDNQTRLKPKKKEHKYQFNHKEVRQNKKSE